MSEAGRDARTELDEFLSALGGSPVRFFPVRHHSPACAWHARELIRSARPRAVLIEGPEDITPLIPFILSPETRAPFAVYTTYVDEQTKPSRFSGYYPFCDYSPELVALRAGAEAGARLRFIDLTYPEQVIAEHVPAHDAQPDAPRSLQDESYLKHSRYVTALARKAGCRDHDDLWDHLFEAPFSSLPTDEFVRRVAAYCFMARLDYSPETLERDGTLARERAMAEAIVEELESADDGRPVVVVTGGFHTAALPRLILESPKRRARPAAAKVNSQTVLTRYSFDQLDKLNGYASGMPSPDYYQRLWQHVNGEGGAGALDAASRVLVEVGHLTRERDVGPKLSAADEIAALEQARRLARFRGHAGGPTREDLLDAVRSCFVKGAMDGEGQLLMDLVYGVLAGRAVGDLPAGVGVPPIVDDFRRRAAGLRLKITDSAPKRLALDIYRKAAHRLSSRFLHSLCFLDVPFAFPVAGPDFVRGVGLERRHEHWEYRWSPQTESRLIEHSVYGSTVEEAALTVLGERVEELEEEGRSRSAVEAVRVLVTACRLGLHRQVGERLLRLIEANVAEDTSFVSASEAVGELCLLWDSREPLEAHRLEAVPRLAAAAYARACYLLPTLAASPPEEHKRALEHLNAVRELLSGGRDELFDAELFYDALQRTASVTPCAAHVAGGVAGLLFGAGRLAEDELIGLLDANLDSSGLDFLSGLLSTCREASWSLKGVLESIDRRLSGWGEEEFLRALPELRLAFADLTPRETDRVAQGVAALYGRQHLGGLYTPQVSESDVLLGVRVDRLMRESLDRDGLGEWAAS
ncbi:MAG TPA: DUF5682 family protein [Pyrinomonadaceae bacterium]|nr:DUF5682 family protein [Pyrinomonadaceae bacterium]